MRNTAILGVLLVAFAAGCAKNGAALAKVETPESKAIASDGPAPRDGSPLEPADVKASSTWIGASAEGDMLPLGTRETFLGVWVDVPSARPETRPPMEVALVVDTSGSMAGAKIENARRAAATLLDNLKDGDIVALDAFSDHATTVVPPTRLDATSRAEILRAIAQLAPTGSTNMFAGLTLAEGQVAAAPSSHALRRIVMISDGIANVGPSTPEMLGAVAERGLRHRAQVTSIGVGNDYDERTLNALSVKSSGRLYHLSEPREMASILKSELDLLDATLASEAFVEIAPAAGVQLMGADGVRADWHDGMLRIPLGALHAGQHREALVRVRITDPVAFEGRTRSLASVRLRFKDAQDSDVERIQEIVARTQLTENGAAIASGASSRTKAIVAIQESAKLQMIAAQRVNDGQLGDADKELAKAEAQLAQQARVVTSAPEKKRLEAAADRIAAARAAAPKASAPAAVQRDFSLKMNESGMRSMGF